MRLSRSEMKMSRMKYDPEEIVKWLESRWSGEFTPTTIGMEVFDLPYSTASGTMCPILSKLCLAGRIERSEKSGKYRRRSRKNETGS